MDQHARRVQKFICAFSTAQNDNILLIGSRTRDLVTGALGRNRARTESRQQITLPHEIYVCHPAPGPTGGCRTGPGTPWCPRWSGRIKRHFTWGHMFHDWAYMLCMIYLCVYTEANLCDTVSNTETGKRRDDCPGLRWRRWRLNSASPVTIGEGSSWRFVCSCERLTMWYDECSTTFTFDFLFCTAL